MTKSLEHLVEEGVLEEIISRLKSGKEADVYVVRYGGKVVAAKVYRDRAQRSFKNRSAYQEGRTVRSSRSQRAIDKGSKFGKEANEDAWKTAEATTLYKLHAAGVRVPTPVLFLEGVLLMEVVLGADGDVAPRLIDIDLTVEEARAAYHDMLAQLVRILSCDLIHGDLSPYNVLWAESGPTIIDFPQAISAAHNSSSERFFLRDAHNILDHFVAADPSLKSRSGDADEIWRAYVRRELSPDFMPSGRPVPQRPPSHPQGQRPPSRPEGQRPPSHPQGQRPPSRPEGQRPPSHPQGQRPPSHPQGQRGPQQQYGQRPPQQGQRAQQSHGQRGPQQQHGQRPPQPQHGQRGPQQQHGQRPPQPQGQRGPQQQRHPNADAPARQDPGRSSGAPRRPRAPEVIVMTRRTPQVEPSRGGPGGGAGGIRGGNGDESRSGGARVDGPGRRARDRR